MMKNIKNTFYLPTQICTGEIENFQEIKNDFVKLIYEFKEEFPISDEVSNRGGWQSCEDFLGCDKHIKKYYDLIIGSIKNICDEFNLNSGLDINSNWININPKYSYNQKHNHLSDLSGCLWINLPENCGDFVFEQPVIFNSNLIRETNINWKEEMCLHSAIRLPITEGMIAIWPAYLPHYVEQNSSDENRISFSFNLNMMI